MLRDIRNAEGWTARLLIVGALLIPLLLGLVLAWQVFPTRWVDTDPSDLRAEHQADYVAMVADSWTVSGNATLARERLYELVDDDTDWLAVDALMADAVAALQTEGNSAGALRISRMRDSVPLPVDAEAVAAAIAENDAPVVAETERAATESGGGSLLPILGLVILLGGGGAAAYVLTMSRRRQPVPVAGDLDLEPLPASIEDRRHGAAISLNPLPGLGGMEGQLVEEPVDQVVGSDEATPFTDAEVDQQGEDSDDDSAFELDDLDEDADDGELEAPLAHMPALEPEDAWHVETMRAVTQTTAATQPAADRVAQLPELDDDDLELADEVDADEPAPKRSEPSASASTTLSPGQLGVFETVYQFGDDDFYHAFTIESPAHEFLGQCGIVISDVLGLDRGQMVDAFDVWLFETQGTRTISKVLASQHAYGTQSISAKLARKGELVLAQEGLMIPLETESIRLTASIEDLSYRKGTPEAASVFDRLKIRMVVEQVA